MELFCGHKHPPSLLAKRKREDNRCGHPQHSIKKERLKSSQSILKYFKPSSVELVDPAIIDTIDLAS